MIDSSHWPDHRSFLPVLEVPDSHLLAKVFRAGQRALQQHGNISEEGVMLEAATLQHITWECLHFITPDEEPAARVWPDERGMAVFVVCCLAIKKGEYL